MQGKKKFRSSRELRYVQFHQQNSLKIFSLILLKIPGIFKKLKERIIQSIWTILFEKTIQTHAPSNLQILKAVSISNTAYQPRALKISRKKPR